MNYWEKRFERLKRQQMGKAETVTAAMRREYTKALTALRKEVLDWYYRYAEENEITLADARKELDARELKAFQLTLKEYIQVPADVRRLYIQYSQYLILFHIQCVVSIKHRFFLHIGRFCFY